jgi:hypothetical protein
MRRRCRAKNRWSYKYYGGRGIKICERWSSYENFLADMGRKPSPAHSLDRINNDGDYEPGNCQWATSVQQVRNRRHPAGPSGARGVLIKRDPRGYVYIHARIWQNGRLRQLGAFNTVEEAAAAYDAAKRESGGLR